MTAQAIVVETRLPTEAAPESGAPTEQVLTALIVRNGDAFVALCRELDIAAEGDRPETAFVALQSAVRQVREVASERGLQAGEAVPAAALEEFLRSHTGPGPFYSHQFKA